MKLLGTLFLFFVLVVSYQNCAQELADVGAPSGEGNLGSCNKDFATITTNKNGNQFTFSVNNPIPSGINSFAWRIDIPEENTIFQTTSQSQLSLQINSSAQNGQISAFGMDSRCDNPVLEVSGTNFVINSGSCSQNLSISCSSNCSEATVGQSKTYSATSTSGFTNLQWQLKTPTQTEWQNVGSASSSYSFVPNTSGTHHLRLLATCSGLTVTSNEFEITANAAGTSHPASLNGFSVNPNNGELNTNIKRFARDASTKRISFLIANQANSPNPTFDGNSPTSGTNCESGQRCFALNVSSASTCYYSEKNLVMTGTNGEQKTETFYTYCPVSGNDCYIGLKEHRISSHLCVNTTLNLSASPSVCAVAQHNSGSCISNIATSNLHNLASGHVIRLHHRRNNDNYSLGAVACGAGNLNVNTDWISLVNTQFRIYVDVTGFCAEYANKEEMDLKAVPVGNEINVIGRCGTNLYEINNKCYNVTAGYYSPNLNNSRSTCSGSLAKPANSSYITPTLTNGFCAWTCNSGYVRSGNLCVLSGGGTNPPIIEPPCTGCLIP